MSVFSPYDITLFFETPHVFIETLKKVQNWKKK